MSGQIMGKDACAGFMENLDAYVDRELNEADVLAFRAHADACEACGAALSCAEKLDRMLRDLDENTTLPDAGRSAWRGAVRALSRERKRRPRGVSGARALVSLAAALVVLVTGTAYLRTRMSGSPESTNTQMAYVNAGPGARHVDTAGNDLWVGTTNLTDGADDGAALEDYGGEGAKDASDQKMIVMYAERRIETEDFDAAEEEINDLVSEYGGYCAGSSVSGTALSESGRIGAYDVRVPSKRLSDFLTALSGVGETVYRSESAGDILADYSDIESRLSSARTQLQRLDELTSEAATVEEILSIEAKVLEVQGEIDRLEAQLTGYANDYDESTVSITLSEKRAGGPLSGGNDALNERMSAGFDASKNWLRGFLRDMAVALAYAAPVLVIVVPLVIIAAVIVHIKTKRRG